ncbi:MAG: WbqC family protein [Candidatus Marinimicrobia bacterium]|nr:WbqC family protein [Candidatus Neomarinimicrobiota bacterium]
MKLAIMQPYFFPYLGYFSLIKHTDEFILFDPVQYIRHGWIERNRILKPGDGWQYIKVPLEKHHRDTLIKDIKIKNAVDWKKKILAQLTHYKKRAPFYKETMEVINSSLSIKTDSIVKLNQNILKTVCNYLEIKKKLTIFSEMNLDIEEPKAPDEWALNICKAICKVDEYWNPSGGKEFFNRNKYEKNNINLKFHEVNFREYSQKRENFENGLSIIDVMMFNSVNEINKMLDNYVVR